MFPLLQCLLKWSYLKGSGTLLRIAEGIKKHTLEVGGFTDSKTIGA